jgi:chemotaxis protein methyltransferase WspC
MTQSVIAALLKSKIGLDTNTIGSDVITTTINRRMANCGITDVDSYLQYLQQSNSEWEALIDSVIIPETWFFREPESFTFLKHYVISQWLPAHSQGVLRVLSVPCATGEEPYSIAIALLQAGLTPKKIHIDAVDISKRCLIDAQRTIYNSYSFRGNLPSFQEHYFQLTPAGYKLSPNISSLVNFIKGNLLDDDFLADIPPYDIVFCRHLLIYFDAVTKKRTIAILQKFLKPEGLLFVGKSEAGLLLKSQFMSVNKSAVPAYYIPKEAEKKLSPPTPTNKQIKPEKVISHHSQLPIENILNLPVQHQKQNLLQTASILADEGFLREAEQLCNEYIQHHPFCTQAYVLLGEVQQAMKQNEQAAASFQKAIYLEPDHKQALTHLALLRENQGDMLKANLLWRRIYRQAIK